MTTTAAVKAQAKRKALASASRKRLATRNDTPVVREAGRGSLTKALAAGEPQNCERAFANLRTDELEARPS